ncbi:MAG: hypothetical protein V9E93_20150 [Steroidobacteraceae bacterium]
MGKSRALTKFSGIHVTRYAGAQLARSLTNSLDAAASVTGHMSTGMIRKYALIDVGELNKSTVTEMDRFMKGMAKAN